MHFHVHKDHFPSWLENSIIILILLVVVQTVLEDLSVIYEWSHSTTAKLTIAGFIFDILFSAEFIARSVISKKRGDFKIYFQYHRGWIDFLSSLPLLLFVSGPAVLILIYGNEEAGVTLGFLSVLKTAKAIRVTRILRLIRVVKLFGKIQNTESVMTNRHVGVISTISVVVMVLVLIVAQMAPFIRLGDHSDYLKARKVELAVMLSGGKGSPSEKWIVQNLKLNPANRDIVKVLDVNGREVYRSENYSSLIWKTYNHGEPIRVSEKYSVVLAHNIADSRHGKENMIIFLSILGLIFAMMFIYSKIFAQQVSDPLYVMEKGFKDWDYNFEVKINPHYSNDEVFELAKAYNNRWLPLKHQIRAHRAKKETEKSSIDLDDIL